MSKVYIVISEREQGDQEILLTTLNLEFAQAMVKEFLVELGNSSSDIRQINVQPPTNKAAMYWDRTSDTYAIIEEHELIDYTGAELAARRDNT